VEEKDELEQHNHKRKCEVGGGYKRTEEEGTIIVFFPLPYSFTISAIRLFKSGKRGGGEYMEKK
jgi:hypothetical protein